MIGETRWWSRPAIHSLGPQPVDAQTVATYHGHPDRSGNFTMPAFTWEAVGRLRLDPGFAPHLPGHLYAQPLYWRPPSRASGMLIAASESNAVTAIDAAGGATLWSRTLGAPAPLSVFGCGNIDPLGITGTPVIDDAGGTLYLDAMVAQASGPRHLAFALSLGDGSVLPGWPIDVGEALHSAGHGFDSRVQNQRGALLIQGGTLYIPYGGPGANCPSRQGRSGVTVLHLRAGAPPAIETAWCGTLSGAGAPIVTTTDGGANPIVWILGAEGDNRLHGFRGDTGEALFTSPPLVGLRHFQP